MTAAPPKTVNLSIEERLTDFAAGFVSVKEMPQEVQLKVTGRIPHFLQGNLYRIGPGIFDVAHADGELADKTHWFDGIGVTFKFSLHPKSNSISFMCRTVCPDAVRAIESTTKSAYKGFSFGAQQDGRSFLEKLYHLFRPFTRDPETGRMPFNINVSLEKIPGQGELVARSDFNYNLMLDPATLEVKGNFDFSKVHPQLKGLNSAAHGVLDESTGEFFNYSSGHWKNMGRYTIFSIKPTGEAEKITEIQGNVACQVHSLAVTPNFIVLAMSPWRVDVLKLLMQRTLAPSLYFDQTDKSTFYVISRQQKRLVAEYECNPFCAFHYINAFEDSVRDALHIDICRYESADIIDQFYLRNLRTKSAEWFSQVSPVRYTLNGPHAAKKSHRTIRKSTEGMPLSETRLELPCIAPAYTGRPYRYSYGVSHDKTHDDILANSLVKLDWETGRQIFWHLPRCCVGEPTFVPNPNGTSEDDGVLLVMVVDAARHTSFLVILDGKTLKELCRAETPQTVPHGFHGMFMSQT